MANRIVGNVYILDTSADTLSSINASISAIGLYGTNSNARLVLSFVSNTADTFIQLANPSANTLFVGITFGNPGFRCSDQLRVQTLVAGTGYIYYA